MARTRFYPASIDSGLTGPRGVRVSRSVAVAVVVLGAALRLWAISRSAGNPFYDAAVRSMGLSWHNFFFGALEPAGSVSVDKTPADLWLQVLSTKLFGFNRMALQLPAAVGGAGAVALTYAVVRSVWGDVAAILAGLALAVLPISVLTARSDTMDSLMTAVLIAALWASVRALQTRRPGWVLAAAALVGVAFNVKLTQALVPLPAFVVLWAAAAAPRRRAPVLLGAGVILVAVGMAWIVAASFTPVAQRPYPIGSGTGSIYRVVFLFNAVDRVSGHSPPFGAYAPTTPGLLRLVDSGAGYSQLIGVELVAALALTLGLVGSRRRRGRAAGAGPAGVGSPVPRVESASVTQAPDRADPERTPCAAERDRVARWTAVGLGIWVVTAVVLFSGIRQLQTRYLETGSPPLAAVLGVSAAALVGRGSARDAARPLAGALALSLLYAGYAASDSIGRGAAGAGVALALAALIRTAPRPTVGRGRPAGAGALLALAALALLALPLRFSVDIVHRRVSDAAQVGSGAQYSAYLRAHRRGARYEVAASDPLGVVGLIVADAQPVLILNDVKGQRVRLATLKQLVGRGAVRYILLDRPCTHSFRCPSTTSWSLRHAVRVRSYLYRFTTAGSPARTAAAA